MDDYMIFSLKGPLSDEQRRFIAEFDEKLSRCGASIYESQDRLSLEMKFDYEKYNKSSKRNAGRKISANPNYWSFRQILEYRDTHTHKQIAETLNMPLRTYYRHLKYAQDLYESGADPSLILF